MKKQTINENNKIGKYQYVFRLYVTGASPNSLRAIANSKSIFEKYLSENYELEIIDVHQQPLIAKEDNIVALPLLIKKYPLSEKRLIGDMSDMEKVLRSIGISNEVVIK